MKFFQIICLLAVLSACSKQATIISQPIVPNTPKSDTFKVNYLALGDSYTIGQSVAFEENFPKQLAKTLANDTILFNEVKIIATTGWTTTNLIDAINNQNLDKKYNLVSLLIGVNNQYQNKPIELYKTEFKTLLNKALALARILRVWVQKASRHFQIYNYKISQRLFNTFTRKMRAKAEFCKDV